MPEQVPQPVSKSVQCCFKESVRSKSIQANPVDTKNAACSPIKRKMADAKLSPIKMRKLLVDDIFSTSESSSSSSDSEGSSSCWSPSDSEEEIDTETEILKQQEQARSCTRYQNNIDTVFLMGVPKDCFWIIDQLERKIKFRGGKLSRTDVITLIFRKIRLKHQFKLLALNYGVSESYVSKLFGHFVPILAKNLEPLIQWLHEDSIFINLPVQFWARYRNVVVIIDCFEIEIETPSNAFDQSETWSEYKKCNTLKFLVGISPDGQIMHVSEAILGRNTDMQITLESKFVEKVPAGKDVMADRGFKGIESLLHAKGSRLIRPPSTNQNVQLTKQQNHEGKKIASLRIHVERLIRRLREFEMLAPHATIHHSLQHHMYDVVKIAAALVNLQGPLIK